MRKTLQNVSVRRAYTLGLALITVLVTLQFVGVRLATERQEVSAIEINLSGRQRMLSQRIAWTMYRLASGNGPSVFEDGRNLRVLLAVCADLMERSHVALQGRDLDEMRAVLAAGGPCLRADYPALELPERLSVEAPSDDPLLAFTSQAWRVATEDPREVDLSSLVRFADGPLIELLDALDQATLAAQETSVVELRQLLLINWCLILALIMAEVMLIFRPMAAAVERSVERLRANNKRLTESEARVMDFAGTAAHQFWETDASHELIWVGAPNADLALYDPEANLGRRPWELRGMVADHDEVDLSQLAEKMQAQKEFRSFEYLIETPDGGRFWWRAHGRPVFAPDGTFQGHRGTAREVTAERTAETRLRVAERMQALGKLTAGVAHDFNNILAVIQGYAELIVVEGDAAVRRTSVSEIINASKRGAALTSQLLSFGRVQRLQAEVIDLGPFLQRLEVLLNRTLGEGFEVRCAIPPRALAVFCDVHQLEDACLNIASNARDACSAGGRLWIETEAVESDQVTLPHDGAPYPTGYIRLSFRDNGAGMSPATQKRVFEPFFTTKPVGEGTGLGLSMVYGFAAQSGGTVEMTSMPDNGTTVTLILPRADAEETTSVVDEAQPRPAGEGKSALVVEDNAALRELTERHLRSLGFVVTDAVDGGSAVERLADKGPFDLLVLDVVLPGGIDGLEIARRARARDPNVAIVFCSGFVDREVWTENSDFANAPVLRKPYTRAAFADAVATAITGSKG